MFIQLTLSDNASTPIFINVAHIVSFARKAGATFTEVHCAGTGAVTSYLVNETVEEVVELINTEDN